MSGTPEEFQVTAALPNAMAGQQMRIIAQVLDALPNAAVLADASGAMLMLNSRAEELLGYPAEELIGQKVERLVPERYQRDYERGFDRAQRLRLSNLGRDLAIIRRDGGEVPVEIGVNLLEIDSGETFTLTVFIDLSGRKLVESMLRESEERLETVFENMTEGLILSSLNGQLLYWNKSAVRLHDFATEEEGLRMLAAFRDNFVLSRIDGAPLELADWPLSRIFQGERLQNYVVRVRRTDRPFEKVFSYSGSTVREPNGQQIAFLTLTDITAQVSAEKEARQAAEFNVTVLNSVDAHIAVLDREGTIVAVNKAWKEFGREEAGATDMEKGPRGIGANYLAACHPRGESCGEGAEEAGRGIRRILNGELESFSLEYPCPVRNRVHWFLLVATPLRSEAGGAVVSHTDITRRKEAEELLRESEQRFRALIDASSQLVWTTNAEGIPEVDSPAWRAFTGQTKEEGAGYGWLNAVHPNDRERVAGAWAEAIQVRQPMEIEYRLRHHSKGWRWMAVRGVPLLNADGTVRVWVGMATDITPRREAEETITRQARFLDQAAEAIMVFNPEGQVTYWNHGAERMFGWAKDEAMGANAFNLLCQEPEQCRVARAEVLASGEWHGELRKTNKAGQVLTCDAHWTFLPGESDQPPAILSIDADVTARKSLEAQYLRAQRMEGIGTLAGGIAHDLNNMLSPIMMSVALLRAKLPAPKDQEVLQMLEEGAARGANLVRQILTFARGVEGDRTLLHPRNIVGDVVKIMRETLLKQITVESEVPSDIWLIEGDPTHLHQVLLNLCVNARDAMPNGGTVTLKAENRELDANYAAMHLDAQPGPYVVLTVSDTGQGIPTAIRDKIFEPFFTTKETGQGTGLGLATSAAIVKSHGGFINLYSEPGRGSTFRVYLPAKPDAGESMRTKQLAAVQRGNNELILVIDDENSIREVARRTLQAFGYRVLAAADGAEGVALFAQQPTEVAVVLTDIMMPIMDGIATIHAIRRIREDVPIIAASGLATDAQNIAARTAGAGHFVQKPYTAEVILRLLQEILRPSGTAS